jgi:quercetin dioxygenase-like cupin family protein
VPYIIHRDDVEPSPSLGEGWFRYDLLGEENTKLVGAACELIVLAPGESMKDHFHVNCEHYIFVLSGDGLLELEGETHAVTQNYMISIEPEEVHALHNTGESTLELLEFVIPV